MSFKVMFVCLGNICRSPVAHAVFEEAVRQAGLQDKIIAESSGTAAYHAGEPADSRMRATAAAHGVTVNHAARAFSPSDFDEYDLILAMDRQNYRELHRQAPGRAAKEKIHYFREWDPEKQPADTAPEVPDPYYGGRKGFETVFRMANRTVTSLLDDIRGKL